MTRLVIVIGVLAAVWVGMQQRSGAVGPSPAPSPSIHVSRLPPQFRQIVVRAPDPAQILREPGALPGLGAIRATADGPSHDGERVPRPFADVGSRREIQRVRRDVRRDLAALNRLSANGAADVAAAERTLAAVYSAPMLRRLGTEGRRAFAARLAGHTEVARRIEVVDFAGVFVSGRRALAQVAYRLSTRSPSGRFVARPPQVWTVRLAREDGRWRFAQGFEAG